MSMIRGLSQPSPILAAITPRSCSPHCMSQSVSILLQPQLHTNSLATSETTRAMAAGAQSQETATQARINPVRLAIVLADGLPPRLTRFQDAAYPKEASGQRIASLQGILCSRALSPIRPHDEDHTEGHEIRADPHPHHQWIHQSLDGRTFFGVVDQDEVQVLSEAAQDPHHAMRLLRSRVKPFLRQECPQGLPRIGDMHLGCEDRGIPPGALPEILEMALIPADGERLASL